MNVLAARECHMYFRAFSNKGVYHIKGLGTVLPRNNLTLRLPAGARGLPASIV